MRVCPSWQPTTNQFVSIGLDWWRVFPSWHPGNDGQMSHACPELCVSPLQSESVLHGTQVSVENTEYVKKTNVENKVVIWSLECAMRSSICNQSAIDLQSICNQSAINLES